MRRSFPASRVCRYHGGAAPQVIKRAQERIRELEHPALDAIAKILDPKSLSSDTARLSAAHDILDRCGYKQAKHVEVKTSTTVDVSKLSTPLLKQLAAELERNKARDSAGLPGAASLPSRNESGRDSEIASAEAHGTPKHLRGLL